MITIAIADDHQVLLDGYKSIFGHIHDIQVLALASDGEEAVKMVEEHQPEVLILDIKMPKLNGVEVCKKIHKKYPAIKIIALSMHDKMSYVKRMFQYGASGYLLKNDSAEIIEKAIRSVVNGHQFLSPHR